MAFWDASNEPDFNGGPGPADRGEKRFEIARFIARTFHELDKKTPVTIGVAFERSMETLGDVVDVLAFHDYLQMRAREIAADIARAQERLRPRRESRSWTRRPAAWRGPTRTT